MLVALHRRISRFTYCICSFVKTYFLLYLLWVYCGCLTLAPNTSNFKIFASLKWQEFIYLWLRICLICVCSGGMAKSSHLACVLTCCLWMKHLESVLAVFEYTVFVSCYCCDVTMSLLNVFLFSNWKLGILWLASPWYFLPLIAATLHTLVLSFIFPMYVSWKDIRLCVLAYFS